MEAAPGLDYDMDAQESFKVAYAYLKSRVEYVFTSPKMKPDTWCAAYWSVKSIDNLNNEKGYRS